MKQTTISAETYSALMDDFDVTGEVMFGKWPVAVGNHPRYPGGPIMLAHIQERFFLFTLDPVPALDPEFVKRATATFNPDALQ